MRRSLVVFFSCFGVVLLSGPAFASLYEGTWDTSTPPPKNVLAGKWSSTRSGYWPDFIGTVGQMQSSDFGIQWNLSGMARTGLVSDTGIIGESGNYYQTIKTNHDEGVFTFRFWDGITYTATLTGTSQWTNRYSLPYLNYYTGTDSCIWIGEGIINEDPDFRIILYSTGAQTDYDAVSNWGTVDCGSFAIERVNPVPIKGGLWLLGSGLLGLLGVRRKLSS